MYFSQALVPNALYSVLLLVDKETAAKPERDIHVQVINENIETYKNIQPY